MVSDADAAKGDSETTIAEKYRSCPIQVDSLRNSLLSSISTKRSSMTDSEILFVDTMLKESLDEKELESMNEVLSCDRTFFGASPASTSDVDAFSFRGSAKRQSCLQARKKQAAEQSIKRAKAKKDQPKLSSAALSSSNPGMGFRRASVNIYEGKGFEVATEDLFEEVYDGDDRKAYEYYDPWLFKETDKNGKRRDFNILGTSHDDSSCHPHVLSPVQMDRLQPFLPDTKKGESFWLKYSLVRDGASTMTFLKQVRASPYTLLAMETIDGEVFGGFFAGAWTVQAEYFGTNQSFLWKMKHARKVPGSDDEGSLVDQIEKESDLEIFPSETYYGNNFFQMCHQDKIAAGGGATSVFQDFGAERGGTYEAHEIGFGLHLGSDGSLLDGSSGPSLTFRNPPLSASHSDGSTFELVNLEAWGFTPCRTEEEARILEYKNMFFRTHARPSF